MCLTQEMDTLQPGYLAETTCCTSCTGCMSAELEAVCLQLKSSTIYVYFSMFEFTQVLSSSRSTCRHRCGYCVINMSVFLFNGCNMLLPHSESQRSHFLPPSPSHTRLLLSKNAVIQLKSRNVFCNCHLWDFQFSHLSSLSHPVFYCCGDDNEESEPAPN